MKQLRWSLAAANDLDQISRYLNSNFVSLAEPTLCRIYSAANSLTQFPEKGKFGRLLGSRELVLSPLPYLIIYSIDTAFIHILRIMHGAQEWPSSAIDPRH